MQLQKLQGRRWYVECETDGPWLCYIDRTGRVSRTPMHGILRTYLALMLRRQRNAARAKA